MTSLAASVQMRRRRFGCRVALAMGMLAMAPAAAQAEEPLFIRIRPLSDADAARAAREALWARRQAHARAVIESVCTGCLGAWAPTAQTAPVSPPAPASEAVANLTVRIGVELDPGPVASDQPDSSTSERHP